MLKRWFLKFSYRIKVSYQWILHQVLVYCIFLWATVTISYQFRQPDDYYIKSNLLKVFSGKDIGAKVSEWLHFDRCKCNKCINDNKEYTLYFISKERKIYLLYSFWMWSLNLDFKRLFYIYIYTHKK